MTLETTVSVVIPAFNEEERLPATVRGAAEYFRNLGKPFELIIVDDGSRDRTAAIALGMRNEYPEMRLLRLAANRGKGYAVRSGVLNCGGSLMLFADADGATPWDQFERLEAAVETGADVAIGSRARGAADVRVRARIHRRLMGRVFAKLVGLLAISGIEDTQCGFKLFRGDVAQELFSRMRMNGFSFDVEVLLMARRRGHRIAEVPVNWNHQPGSRVRLVQDSLLMVRDLLIIRGKALRGEYERAHVAEVPPVVLEAAAEGVLEVPGTSFNKQ
jgi:dolichyl-phosphate beta-glucosyltransferase